MEVGQLPVCYILLRKSLAAPADSRVDSRLRRCLGGITFTEFTFDSRVAHNFLNKCQIVEFPAIFGKSVTTTNQRRG